MKQIFFTLILTALCVSALTTMVSCQSEDQTFMKVDEKTSTKGISANVMDGVYPFQVESNAEWSATLPENCDWATLLQKKGVNNAIVNVVVDANTTGMERHTVITLTSGNEKIAINLRQAAAVEGDAPENSAELIMLAGKKYLGYGCNMLEFFDDPKTYPLKYRSCNIINSRAISLLMDKDDFGKYDAMANTTEITDIDYEAIRVDTIVDKKDELGVSIDIQVSYGLMKFGLSGAYHGEEALGSKVLKIKTGANYPTLESSVNYREILTHYDDWVAASRPENDYRQAILTAGFARLREQLREACNEENASEGKIDEIVRALIRDYGTGVVTRSKLGGLIALEMEVDSMYIKEKLGLDSAKITADIKAGMFALKGEAKASYINDATNHFKHSRHKVRILGGDRTQFRNLLKLFETAQYDTLLADAIINWAESITNANDKTNNAELLEVEVKPIWVMFTDTKSIAAIKKYLHTQYPNSAFLEAYINE